MTHHLFAVDFASSATNAARMRISYLDAALSATNAARVWAIFTIRVFIRKVFQYLGAGLTSEDGLLY